MLNYPTVEKLHDLRLEGMAQALQEQRQQADITQLDFEERLALLVERQWLWREDQFKIAATLEDINYRHPRGLKRAQIDQLRVSAWVKKHQSCLITGSTGTGKTYLACALGHQACREGHRASYYYAPKLFRELQSAQADGSLLRLLKKLARAAVLVIDDFGLAAVAPKQYRDLLEILDDRHGQGATVITSQFPVNQWHELINDATVADAILDRLVHNAYRLELKGESMRKPKTGSATDPAPAD
jgi:DNA replication protein DnaC